jgi:predicted transcriptional regulator
MIEVLATALTVVALVAAAWSLVLAIANRPITLATKPTLALAGVVVLLEVGLLVQAVAGVVNVLGTDRELDRVTFVGYLIGAAVVLPLGAFWSLAERSRWGAGVLTVACLSVPVMILRLNMLWSGHG